MLLPRCSFNDSSCLVYRHRQAQRHDTAQHPPPSHNCVTAAPLSCSLRRPRVIARRRCCHRYAASAAIVQLPLPPQNGVTASLPSYSLHRPRTIARRRRLRHAACAAFARKRDGSAIHTSHTAFATALQSLLLPPESAAMTLLRHCLRRTSATVQ